MLKKIINIIIVIIIIVILFLGYKVFFDSPTDAIGLGRLQTSVGSTFLVLLLFLFIKAKVK